MKIKDCLLFIIYFFIFSLSCPLLFSQSFKHPGGLLAQTDINRIRVKLKAAAQPWKQAADICMQKIPSVDYKSSAKAEMTDSYAIQNDGHAAWMLTVAWIITADIKYANAAKRIINDWEIYEKGGDPLRNGLGVTQLANAGEILRYGKVDGMKVKWPEDEIKKAEKMFGNFYKVMHNYGDAGWGTPSVSGVASMAVFCNDRDKFNEAMEVYKNGLPDKCCGLAQVIFPGTGQTYDSGRDQPHTQGIIGHLAETAVIAWNQGIDIFKYDNNLLLKGFEYNSKYNLGYDVDYDKTVKDCHGKPLYPKGISSAGRGQFSPVYEMVYAYYEKVKGIPAPYSKQVIHNSIYFPETFNSDHIGMGTLLYRRDENKLK